MLSTGGGAPKEVTISKVVTFEEAESEEQKDHIVVSEPLDEYKKGDIVKYLELRNQNNLAIEELKKIYVGLMSQFAGKKSVAKVPKCSPVRPPIVNRKMNEIA